MSPRRARPPWVRRTLGGQKTSTDQHARRWSELLKGVNCSLIQRSVVTLVLRVTEVVVNRNQA